MNNFATNMESLPQIPVPSLIHYELILQILEKESILAADYHDPNIRYQIQQLMVTMRKAIVQQKQIEETCKRLKVEVEPMWALNNIKQKDNSK
jgi:hypothetical protein